MLARAVAVAEQSTCRQQHGAVIEMGSRVLAVGCNRHRNSPNNVSKPASQSSTHAEQAALRSFLGESLKGATMYVARVSGGKPRLSRPCKRCQQLIIDAGIRKVIYTAHGSAVVEHYDQNLNSC